MRIPRGVVGITDSGIVFTEKPVSVKKARAIALRFVGQFIDVVPVGRIIALQFVDNPVYPGGCSPSYGSGERYETARHCVLNGDVCRLRDKVDMSDGGKASITGVFRYEVCESLICWIFARFLNKYGWIYEKCIEEFDNVWISRGNEGKLPDLLLFAGSEDERLALFTKGVSSVVEGRRLPDPPFRVRVQSTDYWSEDKPKIVNWETTVNGAGLFLVWFGNYVLPFRAYYSYPSSIGVKPGFSGSNAFLV